MLRGTGRSYPLAVAVVLVAVAAMVATASAGAAAADGGGAAEGIQAVYVSDGTIHAVDQNGTVVDFGVSAELVTRARDVDGDLVLEVPFVNGSGTLALAEPDGDVRVLASGAAASKATIGVGDLDGDGSASVFYPNASSNTVYGVEIGTGEAPREVTTTTANGVSGVADFDGDNESELVFAGGSSTIKYVDDGTIKTTGYSSIGSNNGYGLGRVADFDGDGVARVPVIDGSNNPALVDASGGKAVPNSGYQSAAKAPVGAVDWMGDSSLELLHLNKSGTVTAMCLCGMVTPVTGPNGTKITGAGSAGVATTLGVPAPEISNFSASNPSGRTVRVAFDSDAQLDAVTVEVDGPESVNATLGLGEFNVSGSGPYAYTANYSAPRDGTYRANLTEAVGPEGNDGATNQSDSVTVATPVPTVVNASLAAADGDGLVGDDGTLRVRAAVDGGNLTSVTANASAFGAGDVPLTRSNGSWTGSFDVSTTGVGNRTVRVVAENEYGNTDGVRTGPVLLDTVAPDANVGPNTTVTVGTNVTFDADATTDRTRIVRYRWAFGDNTTATGVTASHAYEQPGTYTATLTATDAANNTATARRTVNVSEAESSGGGGGGFILIGAGGDEDDGDESSAPATLSVSRTRLDENRVRYEISHANAGERVVLDVPVGEHLRELGLVPARDGNLTLTVVVPSDAPKGTEPVGAERAVETVAYWDLRHEFNDSALREASLSFSLPAERLGNATDVALHANRDDGWRRIDATGRERSNGSVRFRATSADLSAFAVALDQPRLRTTATLLDATVSVGEAASVRAVVDNTGAATGTRTLALRANGTVVERRNVTVPPNGSETVTFGFAPERAGRFDLALRNASVGTLRATSETTATSTSTTTASGGAPGFGALVALAALLVGVLRRR